MDNGYNLRVGYVVLRFRVDERKKTQGEADSRTRSYVLVLGGIKPTEQGRLRDPVLRSVAAHK
jgi:hypothetical protein